MRKAKSTCIVVDCPMSSKARDLCNKHYLRWKKYGDPLIYLTGGRPIVSTPEERFWLYVNKTNTCWFWTGGTKGNGKYGSFWVNGKGVLSHRFAYELLVGPIPDSLQIDHVRKNGCKSTLCVKAVADEFGPAHLEAVTPQENTLRGDGPAALNSMKTHCPKGHSYEERNLYIDHKGARVCKICSNERSRNYQLKKKGIINV